MSLLLVRSGELPAADVARERLFSRVRSNMRRQMIRSAEGPHADPTLERLLTRMDPDVARQLVRSGKPSVTVFHRTRVRSFVYRRFTRSVWILARLDWN